MPWQSFRFIDDSVVLRPATFLIREAFPDRQLCGVAAYEEAQLSISEALRVFALIERLQGPVIGPTTFGYMDGLFGLWLCNRVWSYSSSLYTTMAGLCHFASGENSRALSFNEGRKTSHTTNSTRPRSSWLVC